MEGTNSKCTKCRCWRNNEEFIKKDKVLKTCEKCRENNAKYKEKNKCEHKRIRSQCIDCSGSQICEHKRQRSHCVECGGSQICEHKRIRSQCIDCGGSQTCEHGHGRRRSRCVECGGSQICEHKRIRSRCVECGGSQICEHNRRRCLCQICNFNLYLINLQRKHIKRCFQYTSLKKSKSSIEYLGCDINAFISHMEKKLIDDMTWDNIHIDHIKPVSRFNLDLEEEFNRTNENDKYWNENIIYKEYDKIYL